MSKKLYKAWLWITLFFVIMAPMWAAYDVWTNQVDGFDELVLFIGLFMTLFVLGFNLLSTLCDWDMEIAPTKRINNE